MKQALLDTNFILTCVKEKIDFFHELKMMGFEILIPAEIVKEIEKVINSKQKLHARENARIAYESLMMNKFKEIKLSEKGRAKNVDSKILNYAKKNKDLIIATLDREIKKKTRNKKMVVRGKKKLEVIG